MRDTDLDSAVAAGIVTQAQADSLRAFIVGRVSNEGVGDIDEERFRFLRGFNDFFVAIGIVLFGSAIGHYLKLAIGTYGGQHKAMPALIWSFGAVICWLLSELLLRRMRLGLPGILLSLLFLYFSFQATPSIDFLYYFQIPPSDDSQSILAQLKGIKLSEIPLKAFAVAAAMGLFYARFRLPFSLILIAGSIVIALEALAALFLSLYLNGIVSGLLTTLLCGLAIFAVAMRFDLSDRMRVTRRSDNAFWLHLLAAPLIVHSLISFAIYALVVSVDDTNPTTVISEARTAGAAITTAVVFLLVFVAIVIDRRALLVSALIYVGVLIAYAITSAVGEDPGVFYATLLTLGITVIILGIVWRPLRRLILWLIPASLANRLPPAVYVA